MMPSGEIIVANSRSQELRVFSSSGSYLRTLTDGRGAGSMRSLDRLWRGRDTIYAAEILPAESAVHVFTAKAFVARWPVGSANAGGIAPLARFPDGRLAITAAPRRAPQAPVGMTFIDSLPLGVLALSDLGNPRWIGALKTEMLMAQNIGGGRGRSRISPIPYRFGRSVSYAVSGDRLWIGDSETGTITQHTSSGRGIAVFTAPIAARRLDTALIRRLRMSQLSDAMNWNDRARIDATYSIPFPRMAPRFTRFVPGVRGEMWIERFREDPSTQRGYVVVDASGAAIGQAEMPPRFALLEVGADYVLGVRTDEDGLERIQRYALRRVSP